jgi:hypothetical protein
VNANLLASYVRAEVGKGGGPFGKTMEHACMDCTHQKRYRSDLLDEGLEVEGHAALVAGEDNDDVNLPINVPVSEFVGQRIIIYRRC